MRTGGKGKPIAAIGTGLAPRKGNETMTRTSISAALAAAALALGAAPAQAATFFGPSAYTSAADSPFASLSFDYFHLEDFQDGLLNTPGVTGIGGSVFTSNPGGFGDSVEFTPQGRSYFGSGSSGLQFVFDPVVLGALPTHAGIVWTDGSGTISFEAFDQNGLSLGIVTGNHADNSFLGTTGEDRFYGVFNAAGISRIHLRNTSGGIEADHLQYGLLAAPGGVPEPSAWALLILGFGTVGAGMRTRRRAALALA